MKLTLRANAKINLSLDITGRLPSGYHTLFTVMQSVTLHDTVTLRSGVPGIRLTADAPGVPTDERNTAFSAAALFYAQAGLPPEIAIDLKKRIPSRAGLGGGSADAAAVLQGLNRLYGEPLTEKTLLALALRVGADVPFCLAGGTKLCENLGEAMSPLPDAKAHVLIVKPQESVSTGEAFKAFDAGALDEHPQNAAVAEALRAGDLKALKTCAKNVFAVLSPLPVYENVLTALYENGAYFASLSGSGSALFGLFDEKDAALRAKTALEGRGRYEGVFLCETAASGISPDNEEKTEN